MDTVLGVCGVDGLGVYGAAWGVWAEQWERAQALNAARMEGRCVKSRPGGTGGEEDLGAAGSLGVPHCYFLVTEMEK